MVIKGLEKTAGIDFKNPNVRKKIYKGLEYGGLGVLTGIDAHDAYKAHKEGDKKGRNKALLGAGALVGLMGATHFGS